MSSPYKNPSFNLRIPQELKDWMKEKAAKDHRTLNGFIVKALEDVRQKETNHANHA